MTAAGTFAQSERMGELHVIVGDTSSLVYLLREQILAGRAVTRQVDAQQDAAVALDATASSGLFGPPVVEIMSVDSLDAAQRRRLQALCADTDVFVLARADKLTTAARKDLGENSTTTHFHDAGAGKDPSWTVDLYRRNGITLDGDVRRVLVDAAAAPERVVQALRQLLLAGLTRPNARQLGALLGSVTRDAAAWDVIDAAERLDIVAAENAATRSATLAVIGYEAKRVTHMGLLHESGTSDAGEAARITGQAPFAARKALTAARLHDSDSLLRLVRAVLVADIEAKEGDEHFALSSLIAAVASGARRSRAPRN